MEVEGVDGSQRLNAAAGEVASSERGQWREVDMVVRVEQVETPKAPGLRLCLSPLSSWGPRICAQDPETTRHLRRSPDARPVSNHFLGDTGALGSRPALCKA